MVSGYMILGLMIIH